MKGGWFDPITFAHKFNPSNLSGRNQSYDGCMWHE
jgi:hypothetical protein